MNKFYWSDIKNEKWYDSSEYMTYILIPKKWWSIKQWLFVKNFDKSIQLYFMSKDKIQNGKVKSDGS